MRGWDEQSWLYADVYPLNFAQAVGARHLHRVGVTALGEQALTLGLTDPILLGDVVFIRTHDMPA